eukprot:10180955-Heterocapsa_arctica.AAC.1
MDRADIQHAAKEVCRRMAVPRRCDWQKDGPEVQLAGIPPNNIISIVDTDFAACLETKVHIR